MDKITWETIASLPAVEAPPQAPARPAAPAPRTVAAPAPIDLRAHALAVTAHTLNWPMAWVKVRATCGRFALVDYEPILGREPDLLICLATTRAGLAFNRAMAAFQQARRGSLDDPRGWQERALAAGERVAARVDALNLTASETALIFGWMKAVIFGGRAIEDGITPRLTWQPYAVIAGLLSLPVMCMACGMIIRLA